MSDIKHDSFLLKVPCFWALGLGTSKKDGAASESALPLPPGEESKTVTEKDGNRLFLNSVLLT